jgi:CheY-like chemotaxis protein
MRPRIIVDPEFKMEMEKGTILVVDDEDSIRMSLRDALEDEGYDVFTAANGREALMLLRQMKSFELPKLIILDLMMPIMSGEILLKALQQDLILNRIPRLVFSVNGVKFQDASGWLRKPADLHQLLRQVEDLFFQVPMPALCTADLN